VVDSRTKELKSVVDSLAKANDSLKANEKMQREFINIAAHELRTPIQPIVGLSEIIQSKLKDENEIVITRELIDIIVRNAKRLLRLSSDILEITKIEGGYFNINKEKFDLNDVILESTRQFQNECVNKNIQVDYTPKTMPVFADRSKIFQVISNLLSNSIKFSRDSNILVLSDVQNNNAIVSVKDYGRGIDKEILPRLFTKFAIKSENGTGLGLYISKTIVEAHGGSILAENNKDGKGATFTFNFPLADKFDETKK
jgi:signal transduction histidine kinase